MKKWHYIESGRRSAAYNMALDEALLNWHSEGKIGPVLRFYEWERPTLSIGYFQQVERDINLKAVEEGQLQFVRRQTGGRGVLHDDELTYSVIVSEQYPNMPENVTEAYRVISTGLLEGFRKLGFQASFSIPETEEEKEALQQPKSGVCFDTPSWYELVVENKKIAGSAQTRKKGVILQHGAILRHLNIEKLISLFRFSSKEAEEKMRKSLPNRAVAIDQITSKEIEIPTLIEAFREGFEKALKIQLVPYTLSEEQEAEVHELVVRKYGNDQWNFKR